MSDESEGVQLGEDAVVGGQEVEREGLFGRDPAQTLLLPGCGYALEAAHMEEMQAHMYAAFGVVVFDDLPEGGFGNGDAEFFENFAGKGV